MTDGDSSTRFTLGEGVSVSIAFQGSLHFKMTEIQE